MSYRNKRHGMAAREQTSGKKPKRSLRNFCIIGCFLAFMFGCYWNYQKLQDDIAAVYQEAQLVENQIDDELEKQIDIKAKQSYYSTDEYYMRLARMRFNLLLPGEHLYVFE